MWATVGSLNSKRFVRVMEGLNMSWKTVSLHHQVVWIHFFFFLKALEFLLWACMCLESSVPLLTVKYLTWRSTLYTAVCQCYFDLKVPMHAEAFAKRGLGKVNELQEIEKMSTSEATLESEAAFRQAKTKMQVMIFKRVVFETRKRPKGLLRPKTKPNLKDFAHVSNLITGILW